MRPRAARSVVVSRFVVVVVVVVVIVTFVLVVVAVRILLVEDEADLAAALARALREEGYACDVASDGRAALHALGASEYDLVILDLMLPELDGRSVLGRLRAEKPTPVLVLTARDAVHDKVALFDAGADDYVTKPFELEELLARARALVRRGAGEARPRIEIGEIVLHLAAREVSRTGERIALTPKEYALLEFLALHRGELVPRARLYEHLYDEGSDTASNVIDVHVSNLRRKLAGTAPGRRYIHTVRGVGFRLSDDVARPAGNLVVLRRA